MISTIRQTENVYSEARDRIFENGRILGLNGVKWEFHHKSSKVSL